MEGISSCHQSHFEFFPYYQEQQQFANDIPFLYPEQIWDDPYEWNALSCIYFPLEFHQWVSLVS